MSCYQFKITIAKNNKLKSEKYTINSYPNSKFSNRSNGTNQLVAKGMALKNNHRMHHRK